MMLRTVLSILVFSTLVFYSSAVCPDSTGYTLTVSTEAEYGATACRIASSDSTVYKNDTIYVVLDGWSGTTPTSVVWKDNGATMATYTTNFPESYQYAYSTTTTGNHKITCTYNFETSCSITKTVLISVTDRFCPLLTATLSSSSNCLFPEDTLDVVINTNGSIDVVSCEWTVFDEENNVYSYTSIGDTFHFIPSPGTFTAQATAMIQIDDTTFCYTDVNGTNCDISLSSHHYSDPFFELVSDYYSDSDVEVIFKGSDIYPEAVSPATHDYTLYLDNVQTGSVQSDLLYNQTVYTYSSLSSGSHTIKLAGAHSTGGCTDNYEVSFTISADKRPTAGCESCNTFKPIAGEKYWLSAWVMEDRSSQVKSYDSTYIKLVFDGASQDVSFHTTGDLVEGWQRIVGSFTIPGATTDIKIRLMNETVNTESYFDDVRIHPFNASMKSYVYDPVTLWLVAELDDNNYATFYEYDSQGQLIRIKKETDRGIMTIQESRSSNPKQD